MKDKRTAYRFIFLMGLVSLLSDFTYEGAKGVLGPYLAYLGASALAVGFVAGLSEFLGYAVRLFAGYLSDRLKSLWLTTFLGYAVNLFSVPLMGLAPTWHWVAFLSALERLGKGIRTPSRDALLSKATMVVGHGRGFGLHEFMDQLGAVSGPVFVGALLFVGFGYRHALLFLFLPALLALFSLYVARRYYKAQELTDKEVKEEKGFKEGFYVYVVASCFVAFGFLPFALVGYHGSFSLGLEGWQVSFIFAFAMLVDAFGALLFGYLFDRYGFFALLFGLGCGVGVALLLFFGGLAGFLLGVFLWGLSMGVQESIMRSAVARLSKPGSRATAYGLFHFLFGLSTLLGSTFMGWLYTHSLELLVLYSAVTQMVGIALIGKLSKGFGLLR